MSNIPHRDHVIVHLLQLLLCGVQFVRGRVELVRLETLVGELDGEILIIFLPAVLAAELASMLHISRHTSGTSPFSACELAASVVTVRFAIW